jgi:hypothetical protein
VSADDYKHLEWWDVMKIGGAAKKAKNMYVKDENPALRAVIAGLKKVVKELVPGTKETVNAWGVPTFVAQNPFAFYMVGKKHVTFGFPFATALPDPEGLLEGTGKNMRHVKLRTSEDLDKKGLRELIVAASRFEGGAAMPGMGANKRRR